MPTTTNYGFRYPTTNNAANVPQDIQNLATDVDNQLKTVATGTTGTIAAAAGWDWFASGHPNPFYHLSSDGVVTLHGIYRRTAADFTVATDGSVYNFATLPAAIIPTVHKPAASAYIGLAGGRVPCVLNIVGSSASLGFIAYAGMGGTLNQTTGFVNINGYSYKL